MLPRKLALFLALQLLGLGATSKSLLLLRCSFFQQRGPSYAHFLLGHIIITITQTILGLDR